MASPQTDLQLLPLCVCVCVCVCVCFHYNHHSISKSSKCLQVSSRGEQTHTHTHTHTLTQTSTSFLLTVVDIEIEPTTCVSVIQTCGRNMLKTKPFLFFFFCNCCKNLDHISIRSGDYFVLHDRSKSQHLPRVVYCVRIHLLLQKMPLCHTEIHYVARQRTNLFLIITLCHWGIYALHWYFDTIWYFDFNIYLTWMIYVYICRYVTYSSPTGTVFFLFQLDWSRILHTISHRPLASMRPRFTLEIFYFFLQFIIIFFFFCYFFSHAVPVYHRLQKKCC